MLIRVHSRFCFSWFHRLFAVGGGGGAVIAGEDGGEVVAVGEAEGSGDFGDGDGGSAEQESGAFHAHHEDIFLWGDADLLFEEVLIGTGRHIDGAGDGIVGESVGREVVEEVERLADAGIDGVVLGFDLLFGEFGEEFEEEGVDADLLLARGRVGFEHAVHDLGAGEGCGLFGDAGEPFAGEEVDEEVVDGVGEADPEVGHRGDEQHDFGGEFEGPGIDDDGGAGGGIPVEPPEGAEGVEDLPLVEVHILPCEDLDFRNDRSRLRVVEKSRIQHLLDLIQYLHRCFFAV